MRRPIQRFMADNRGIATSLMEATLVITIAAVLSSVAVAISSDQVADADRANSSSEVKLIGVSILAFMQDTGHAPAFRSGDAIGASDPFTPILETEGSDPDDTTGTWPGAENRDLLDNHLNRNNPAESGVAYVRPGEIAHARFQGWNGPYMSKLPAADPWGDKYLANTGFLTSQGVQQANLPQGKKPAVFVISAGANRSLETRFLQAADEFQSGGDDLVFRIQ